MLALLLAAGLVAPPVIDRGSEGDWYVSDDTDNNTGQRNVYAFVSYLKQDMPDYLTLYMRCSQGKPTLFVEWTNLTLPDQAVLTIGPVANPEAEPAEQNYIFAKPTDRAESGMKATPETSAQIIAAMGMPIMRQLLPIKTTERVRLA